MSDNLTPAAALRNAVFTAGPATPPQTSPAAPIGTARHAFARCAALTRRPESHRSKTHGRLDAQGCGRRKISAEQAEKIFTELGVPLEDRVTKDDTRSDEVKLIDEYFPVAKPEEFSIRYGLAGQELPMSAELKKFDGMARGWLAAAGFDRGLGNSVVNQIEKVTQHTQHMTPNELEDYGYREFAKLEKIYGNTLDERLREANRMVHELDAKQPGVKNLLKSRGIGDNSIIASILIGQATIYHARKGR